MTLLVAWIGTDDTENGKAISSLYIGSDSRYTWITTGFNCGQKLFCSKKYPEIFGFCGDVLFPMTTLSQLMNQIDSDLLIRKDDSFKSKKNKVADFISNLISSYPSEQLLLGFTIIYGTKIEREFKLFEYKYDKTTNYELKVSEIPLPDISTKVYVGGSGKKEFDENWDKCDIEKDNNRHTSRQVYHCLSTTIRNIKDPATGGIPQVVGIYRGLGSRVFGIIEDNTRYISGIRASDDTNLENVEWRNTNFERVNPLTMKLKEGAQIQPFQ